MKHQITHNAYSATLLESTGLLIQNNLSALNDYSNRLAWWNKRINLISRDVSHETIKEHIRHSLLLGGVISKCKSNRIIDTGTGGGLPGLPLAICFPKKRFILNDVVSKKIMAVKQMVGFLELKNIETLSMSIEDVNVETGDIVVTKHAFKINQLIRLLGDKNWKEIYFLKGEKEVEDELSGINEGLDIEIFTLDAILKNDFYKGKGIIKVKRRK